MKNRPTGITLISVFFIALAIISFIWSLIVFGIGGLTELVGGLFQIENMAAFGGSNVWSGFFGIVAAALQFAAAVGLLLAKRWAWYLAVLAVGLSVFQGVIGLFGGGTFSLLCGALLLLIPIGILLYLLSGGVRKFYRVD